MPRANSRGFARAVDAKQRAVHKIHVRYNGATNTIINGAGEVSLTDNGGTGDHTLTLAIPAKRMLCVTAMGEEADTACAAANVTTSSVDILVTDLAGTAKDATVSVEITVSDDSDEKY